MKRFWVLLFPFLSAAAQSIDSSALTGYRTIQSADLRAHLNIIASDSMEGREVSFPGQKKAARYIANVFRKLNLTPIGDDGTYFQHFNVEVRRPDPDSKILFASGGSTKTFSWEKDFLTESAYDTVISGPVAFLGFPDNEIADSVKIKLAKHVGFVFAGKREFANDTSREAMLRRLYAFRRETGIAALFIITDKEGASSFDGVLTHLRGQSVGKGKMRISEGKPFELPHFIRYFSSWKMAEEVLQPSGISLNDLRNKALQSTNFSPVVLSGETMTIQSRVIYETRQTENVVALLSGSDPQLKHQAVVFSGHYDHLGKDENGVIYYGADDDGTGTATVLELAQAFAQNPVRPKRSCIFLVFTGEEKGLFGSTYYTDHPFLPFDSTIADLHTDMIGRVDPKHEKINQTDYTYVIGSDKISLELDSLLRAANGETGSMAFDYQYNDDNDPEQFYRRSDHYNFAKHNVPVVFFFTGEHADYHKPTDTVDKILFDRMANIVRLIYDLGWKLGNFDHLLRKDHL
jgi:hypothetical protein